MLLLLLHAEGCRRLLEVVAEGGGGWWWWWWWSMSTQHNTSKRGEDARRLLHVEGCKGMLEVVVEEGGGGGGLCPLSTTHRLVWGRGAWWMGLLQKKQKKNTVLP